MVVCVFVTGAESSAQNFGLQAGLNLSNVLMKDNEGTYSDEFKMNPGFHFGITMEVPFNEVVSFDAGLLLTTKGFRETYSESDMYGDYEYKMKANVFYLDVPLTAKFTHDAGGVRIYGALGPYVGVALSGKMKWEDTFDGVTESGTENIPIGNNVEFDPFGDDEPDLIKRFDFGLTFGAGIEINAFRIGVSYGLGLANISSYTDEGTAIKNRVLGISLGYTFTSNDQ